jgi:tight adherence protein C
VIVPTLVILGAASIATAVTLLVWAVFGMRGAARSLVTTNLQRGAVTDLRELTLGKPSTERTLQPLVAELARWVRHLSPAGAIISLERKLVLAGRPSSWPVERVLATKVLLGTIGILVLVLRLLTGTSAFQTALLLALTVLLFFTPDVVVSSRAKERQRTILAELPDALDQITICMEAGLGFEGAIARASHANSGPLAQELVRTMQEVQVGVGRREALQMLAERNDVQDLRHFVTAILQAEQYGVPIADVLRDQAKELRTKRRQRAEEAARKLPLKLLLPLIAFIMPPLFIILIGPAALRLIESFSQIN